MRAVYGVCNSVVLVESCKPWLTSASALSGWGTGRLIDEQADTPLVAMPCHGIDYLTMADGGALQTRGAEQQSPSVCCVATRI